MTSYDREILVPYLRDLYSVELLLLKIDREYEPAAEKMRIYQSRLIQDRAPEKPRKPRGSWVAAVCIGAVSALTSIAMFPTRTLWFPAVLVALLACAVLICARRMLTIRNRYLRKMRQYSRDLRAYEDRAAEREQNQQSVDQWKPRADELAKRRKEVSALRARLYAADVIPQEYHNVYAAHYLYDQIRFGGAQNIQAALAAYDPDAAKRKLEGELERQFQLVLGQRRLLAKRDKMNELIAPNRVDAAAGSLNLQILQAHQAVTDYFANLDE